MSKEKVAEKMFESIVELVNISGDLEQRKILHELVEFITLDIEWLEETMSQSDKKLLLNISKYINGEIKYSEVYS
jgi:hypothetical protein